MISSISLKVVVHLVFFLSYTSSEAVRVCNGHNPQIGSSDWKCSEKRCVVDCEGANHKYTVH